MGYGKYVGNNSRLFDDSFTMSFINYGNKIIHCAMYFLYISYINESTNFAESLGVVAILRIGDMRRMKIR
jgi:hypothetical protein